ncbi:hypothetical protein KCQ77_06850 [Corynebacterium sp. L24]|nr:hypothetical protein [Corynebacterium parakroppenstedtii]
MANRRITAVEIAEILDVSRRTATTKLNNGLSADELIDISRSLGLSPIHALVELGKITYQEAYDFLDNDGQLVETAEDGELALELAKRLNPATRAPEIDELAAQRKKNSHVTPSAYSDSTQYEGKDLPYAADSSPVEPEPGDDDYSDGP